MRICSILTSFTTGGAETLVENLSMAFAARGHRPAVLTLSHAEQVGNSPATEQQMLARLTERKVETRSLALANRRNILAGSLALRRALQALEPDVIHSHTAGALPLLAIAGTRAPVILTHHNSRLSFPPRAYWLFDRIVSRYVAISQQCAMQTREHSRRPIRTILNAANARFQASRSRSSPARNPVILAVGTPSEQKDYLTLIKAAAHLRPMMEHQGRRPLIRIVGGGPLVETLRDWARQYGVDNIVEVAGVRSDVDVLMREADVFVNSSLWEGFPIAMIEASMSGLPIVATHVAGNREMVADGVNGTLVPAKDPEALARAMERVLSDAQLYAQLSRGSLLSAERFSIEACTDQHLHLYDELIGARRKGGDRPRLDRTLQDRRDAA